MALIHSSSQLRGVNIKITLSKRLGAVANEIHGKSIADIGTDHAYIPIYTCLNGITDRAVACDINPGPLNIAKSNIKRYCLENVIETRLCYGLDGIKPNEVECAVIAGMGGGLIIDILKKAPDVLSTLDRLVLQPQLDIPEVRRYIHTIGLKISNERMIKDVGKCYNIIVCEHGTDVVYSEAEYLLGKKLIEQADATFKEYLSKQLRTFTKIKQSIQKAGNTLDEDGKRRLLEVEKLIQVYSNIRV